MKNVNHSLNGTSGTSWEIRRQEAIHFYLGYRQAILIAGSLQKNLKLAKLERRKTQLGLSKEKERFQASVSNLSEIEKEIFLGEIEIIEDSLVEGEILIRDAELELAVAQSEEQRIVNAHPELLGNSLENSYSEVQLQFSQAAFLAKLARSVAISTYASMKGVSDATAEVIVDSDCLTSEEQRLLFASWSERMAKLIPAELENQVLQSEDVAKTDASIVKTMEAQNGASVTRN